MPEIDNKPRLGSKDNPYTTIPGQSLDLVISAACEQYKDEAVYIRMKGLATFSISRINDGELSNKVLFQANLENLETENPNDLGQVLNIASKCTAAFTSRAQRHELNIRRINAALVKFGENISK